MSELVLTNDYGSSLPLVLTSDETGVSVRIEPPSSQLVLELTSIVGGSSSGVSGPAIYAFAAAYG